MINSSVSTDKFVPYTYIKQSIYSDNIKITGIVCVVASLIATIAAAIFLTPEFIAIGLAFLGVSIIGWAFTHCYVYMKKETSTMGGPPLPPSPLDSPAEPTVSPDGSLQTVVQLPKRSASLLAQEKLIVAQATAILDANVEQDYPQSPGQEVQSLQETQQPAETPVTAAETVVEKPPLPSSPAPTPPKKVSWSIFTRTG